MTDRRGGYDDGYSACACFWGTEPGSLLPLLDDEVDLRTSRVLDLGCGEGKNARHLADRGATVVAIDVSELAVRNGRAALGRMPGVRWAVADVASLSLPVHPFDVVLAYGLLHCLSSEAEAAQTVAYIQAATCSGGLNVVCTMNSRRQELAAAHPGFHPCLLSHEAVIDLYAGWDMLLATDQDRYEVHPHNEIWHHHSLTRLIARRP